MTEAIKLTVDGTIYGGWEEVHVTRSIEQGAAAFSLRVTERWKGQPTRRQIRPGAKCKLIAGSDVMVEGYVDDVNTDYDIGQHTVTVAGRDMIGDLIDSAAVVDDDFEFLGLTITDFSSQIAAPFGIAVRAEVDVGEPFDRFAVQPGETAWEAIERACRLRALLPNGDGRGGLVLTRAGKSGAAAVGLELGQNIKTARGTFSYRDRHSLTVVRGQQEGSDSLDAEAITAPEGRAKDTAVKRYRPTVIIAEQAGNGLTFEDRAKWQVRVDRGRSRTVSYTVAGWRSGGALWRPNTMVPVRDDYLDIDFSMLIVSVTFDLTLAGTTATLALSLPDAYDLLPEPEEPAATSGLWEGL